MRIPSEKSLLNLSPPPNTKAIKLAFSLGMTPVGARLRMFKNGHLDEPYENIYGFTTLDIV